MARVRWSVVVATLVCAGASIGLGFAAFGPAAQVTRPELAAYLLMLVPLSLAWVVAVRAPDSPVGPALAWLAAFILATPAVEAWGQAADDADLIAVLGESVWAWQLVGFMALLLVFPDGLLPGVRWRIVAALVPVSALVMTVAMVVTLNHDDSIPAHSPVSVPEAAWLPVMLAALGTVLAVTLACGASVVVRYRSGDERTRQQLRWLLLAAGCVVVLMVGSWVVTALGWAGPAAYTGFLLGIVVLVPAAVAVAVLRYDLFEIDRILSDSVAWLLTTVITTALLATSVVVVGSLVGRGSKLGLTGAVFVVALLVLPLHRRVHDIVGRVLDSDRTVLLEHIRSFVDQVRDGSAEPEAVEGVLRAAVRDPGLTLLLLDVETGGHVDLTGAATEPGDGIRIPLRTADTEIGVLVVTAGSARRVRQARLAASAARLPIEVSRLRIGLRRALAEVDDSRRRLVSAVAEERRRLERDLHDGAQQQLVALGMQLRAAQRLLPPAHPVSDELDQAVESLERTVGELRRLAHGVRPTSLDDGLPAALGRLGADCPIPIEFVVDDAPASEVVATTAYFVVAEALANVLKHARASRVAVNVGRRDGALHVSVADDGVGGVPAESGLATLRDRVASVGGRLAVTSRPSAGTTIEAVLPCVS